ncbi:TPA: hypothetical protein ACHCBX_002872 [Vibrio parahaemolyticus]|uniref:hypothetical protein n=1 Tax=Vibrio parahaemolyticus TaxID=670 RepID=UPI0005B6EF97|nr:hypothetical protein [Vibrio parahaemolyticus]EGQ7778690.1 hypothetical protein [Vibrio parahaemolyticus]EGQ8397889.1 hypothetical protein [Vibrio parahaemolyticus]EGQ9049441.1 hypothetical protein [Vibrio parahaemolyticus]EGQ9147943.1 hypothetical protein [Vibrio parahaemolyticus]EGQ9589406.1 hypothetical protein [Vibrio parahaemolyticus]
MALVKFTEVRNLLKMNVSSEQLDKFESVLKVNPRFSDLNREQKITLNMMSKYLREGKNHNKILRINSLINEIQLDFNYVVKSSDPKLVSDLIKGRQEGRYQHCSGTNRDVFIDIENGVGYKVFKTNSSWRFLDNADLRVNDIYKNKGFYGGKYAKYANNSKIKMIDDRGVKPEVVDVFRFELIPNAKPLFRSERIPKSVLVMMEKCGYMPFDVKPDNFVKVLNDKGKYDYLPIDSKQIGKVGSGTVRTQEVIEFKKMYGAYYYGGRYVDERK